MLAKHAAADAEATLRMSDLAAEDLAEARRRERNYRRIVRAIVAISIAGLAACAFMLFK